MKSEVQIHQESIKTTGVTRIQESWEVRMQAVSSKSVAELPTEVSVGTIS